MIEKQKPLKKRKRIKLSQMKMSSSQKNRRQTLVLFIACSSYQSEPVAGASGATGATGATGSVNDGAEPSPKS